MPSSADRPVITIDELDAADQHEAVSFYQRILLPSFRAAELVSKDDFVAGLKSGQTRALVARTAQRVIAGGAVSDFFPRSRALLLSYLAVPAEGRGAGTGGMLFKAVSGVWGRELSPSLLVMEVQDPRYAQNDPALGDPQARVRFYERLGARALPPTSSPPSGPPGSVSRT